MPAYAYDQAWQHERERLAGLEALQDPGTRRILADRGLAPGWRCLEVGGGGGSIVEWLADQVGPDGRVLATDLDTRFLEAIDRPNVEVRRHDIADDPLPDERFDLVHSRYVLEHIPRRAEVLARLVTLLAPGGWLVLEDSDWAGFGYDPPDATADRVSEATLGLMESAGFDRLFGRKLPAALMGAGLVDVGAEGRANVSVGPHSGMAFTKLSLTQLAPLVVAQGAVTQAEIDDVLAKMDDPTRTTVSTLTVAAWGRLAD